MNDKLNQTQRILRSSKVKTDQRGRTVWSDTVETAKLELISTQMLKQIIASDDTDANSRLREVAEGDSGLLARDTEKDRFEIINDEELQRILDGTDTESAEKPAADFVDEPPVEDAADEAELELVNTQMLRVMLGTEDDDPVATEEPDESGFDPYDSSLR